MNKERLLDLADFLATQVPADKFDLSTWWHGACGCAIGWAMQYPAFNDAGLRKKPTDRSIGAIYPGLIPECAGYENWQAVQAFFEISEDHAYYLFEDAFYPDTKQSEQRDAVITRIRDYVQRGDVNPEWAVPAWVVKEAE